MNHHEIATEHDSKDEDRRDTPLDLELLSSRGKVYREDANDSEYKSVRVTRRNDA